MRIIDFERAEEGGEEEARRGEMEGLGGGLCFVVMMCDVEAGKG